MIPKAKSKGMYFEPITITPEMASAILAQNEDAERRNRSISRVKVVEYSQAMRRKQWKCDSGECLKVDTHGNWIDGQHRLSAIVMADMPVKMLVMFNVAGDSFDVMDTGKTRGPADILSIYGKKNCSVLSAALTMLKAYEAGDIRYNCKLANSEVHSFYQDHHDIDDSVAFNIAHRTKKGLLPGSVIVLLHYLFVKINKRQADEFMAQLITGINLKPGSLLLKLRERFWDDSTSKYKMPKFDKVALCIKVWNSYREVDNGEPRRGLLRFHSGSNEAFPKPM